MKRIPLCLIGIVRLFLLRYDTTGGQGLPAGLLPSLKDNRYQGDFFGGGLLGGYSWWLSGHFRIELELGLGLGYYKANQYECAHCGQLRDTPQGVGLVPRLGVNIAYNFYRRRQLREDVLKQIRKEEEGR